MNKEKISISLDEINSPNVDAALHRQDIADRMAQHQQKIRTTFGGSGEMLGAKGGFFRKSIVYMTIFGLIFSIVGWLLGEIVMKKSDDFFEALIIADSVSYFSDSKDEKIEAIEEFLEEKKEFRDNSFLPEKIVDFIDELEDLDDEERYEVIKNEIDKYQFYFTIILGVLIAVGLSIAEEVVSKNFTRVLIIGIIATILGAIGGFVVALFINDIYNALQGDSTGFCFQQILARAVGWSILGAFLAIAPGIMMRSPKKFLLGLIGGAIGGFIGGALFDPICFKLLEDYEHAVVVARCVNILGLGVGAAMATVLLENAAKQGWLKVATGVIMGKQFILYRNPTIIGSSPKCEIYLFKDPSVAPQHAAINNRNGEFIITAISGTTVLINNAPIRQQRLRSGDLIQIGNTIFVFEAKAIKPVQGYQ